MFTVRQFDARTLVWWLEEREEIDMNPPYQRRGGLWNREDKAFLIDSIINEFDVPKFYLADFTYGSTELNKARKKYAVIDGKQRFEAIFGFFQGDVTLNKDFIYLRDPALQLGGLGYKDLKANHPKVVTKFENFNPSIMSVVTDDEAKISELFVRLNNSKPLTGPEVRNAMRGIVPELIGKIADHSFFKHNIGFVTKRMQDKNVAAKLLLIEHRGKFVDTKKANLDRLAEEGAKAASPKPDFERAAKRVEAVLDRMTKVFVPKDPLLSSQGPITPYYWLVRNAKTGAEMIREFLVHFDQERRENRKSDAHDVDRLLLEYDIMNRATNDPGSLSGRYIVLVKRFREFLKSRGVEAPAELFL